jgi:Icc-related predicted phosphoesterase
MRLCIISDTHSLHRQVNIPEADALIHAGDITHRGELSIIEDFTNWLKEQPAKYKIVIFGNHSLGMERGPKRKPAISMLEKAGAIYLDDSGCEIDGIKFWGSSITPEFCGWEYNRQRGKDIQVHWDKIDPLTEVLVSHGPAFGILDEAPRGFGRFENAGCKDLLDTIDNRLKNLRLHCFGHIHRDSDEQPIVRDNITYANASILNNDYKLTNTPIILDI